VDVPQDRRYCFQTTYLNECFPEYATLGSQHRLIWVLRNPYSVIYSMLNNWRRFALNELYESVRHGVPDEPAARWRPWPFDGPSLAAKACVAYRAKTSQIVAIKAMLDPAQLLIVEYDQLVQQPCAWLPRIFDFIGEPFDASYVASVRTASVKKADRISPPLKRRIDAMAMPAYNQCLSLVSTLNRP
jgi:hypothetical protein